MDRFLYITDPHYGANPITRKDNYNESILRKFGFAFELAKVNNCIVLIGGDLFDNPRVPIYDLLKLFDLVKTSGVQIVSLRGNPTHDGLYEVSPLTLMEKSGLITTSDNKDFLDFPETRIIFSDNANPPYGKDKFLHNDKMNVLMTHCILVNEPTIYDHILIDELETNADIVTVADYHPYQGILERKDGVKFLAPGAMCRRKRTKHDMERKLRGMYFTSNRKMKEFMIPYVEDVWNTKIVEPENISQDIKEEVGRMKLEIDAELSNMSLDKALEVFFSMKKTDHVVASFIQERIKTL